MTFFKFPISSLPVFGSLSKNEARMLLAIMSHTNRGSGECWATVETLAGYTGMSRSTGQMALGKLIKSGAVIRNGRLLSVSESITGAGVMESTTQVSRNVNTSVMESQHEKSETQTKVLAKPEHKEKRTLREKKKRETKEKGRKVTPEAQELWDHWLTVVRPLYPNRKYPKKPSDTDMRNLPKALEVFSVDDLKDALTGLPIWMEGDDFWSRRQPAFYFAFSAGAGAAKSFNLERAQVCIEAAERKRQSDIQENMDKVRPRVLELIERLCSEQEFDADGPDTWEGYAVLRWRCTSDVKWAQISEYDGYAKRLAVCLKVADMAKTETGRRVALLEAEDAKSEMEHQVKADQQKAQEEANRQSRIRQEEEDWVAAGGELIDIEQQGLPFDLEPRQ